MAFGIDDMLTGLVGGAVKAFSNAQQNEYAMDAAKMQQQWNVENQMRTQAFNAQEAQLGRDFSASSMEDAQAYSSAEAIEAREFNAQQADISRTWSAGQQQEAMLYNASQADLNRQFQERMSSTAYQRSRADMVAAGLNPILAAGAGGASTPTGGMGSIGAVGGAAAQGPAASSSAIGGPNANVGLLPGARVSDGIGLLQGAISSAGEAARLQPQVDVLKSENEVKQAQEHNIQALTQAANAQTAKTIQETATERERAAAVRASTQRDVQEAKTRATEAGRFSVGGPFGSHITSSTGAVGEMVTSAKRWWDMLGE